MTSAPGLNRARARVDAGGVRSMGGPGPVRSTMRRAIVAAIALALVVAVASPGRSRRARARSRPGVTDDPFTGSPSAPAGAGSTGFRFFGSGFGHGIGMSQWGAYGLAQMGWTHKRILKQFYRSTRVERLADPVRSIRVGLTWDHTVMHVEAKGGPVHLWVGREGGRKVGRIPAGRTWTVRARASGFAVTDHDGKLVGGRTWGGTGFDLIATYGAGARAFVPRRRPATPTTAAPSSSTSTSGAGRGTSGSCCRSRSSSTSTGSARCRARGRPPRCARRPWPVARSPRTRSSDTPRTASATATSPTAPTIRCTWATARKRAPTGTAGSRPSNDTRGQVVTHNGNVIQAFYAASDGGHSDAVEDVWHGGNPAFAIAYLKAECDPGEDTAANPWTDWQKSLTARGAHQPPVAVHRLDRHGARVRRGPPRGGRPHHPRDGARAKRLGLDHRVGAAVGDRRLGRAHLDQRGQEHHGADPHALRRGDVPPRPAHVTHPERRRRFPAAVQEGRDLPHGERRRHGVAARPRLPRVPVDRGTEQPDRHAGVADRRRRPGRRHAGRSSSAAASSAKAGSGTHALWGRVLAEYLDRGGTDGALGFPTSRVRDDGAGGTLADFEHGTIVCPDGQGCRLA